MLPATSTGQISWEHVWLINNTSYQSMALAWFKFPLMFWGRQTTLKIHPGFASVNCLNLFASSTTAGEHGWRWQTEQRAWRQLARKPSENNVWNIMETSLLFTSWCLDVAWLFIDRIRCSKEFIGIGSWLHNDVPSNQAKLAGVAGNPPNATIVLTHLHTSSVSLTRKESLSRKSRLRLWSY